MFLETFIPPTLKNTQMDSFSPCWGRNPSQSRWGELTPMLLDSRASPPTPYEVMSLIFHFNL
jgi:hypothetical protein